MNALRDKSSTCFARNGAHCLLRDAFFLLLLLVPAPSLVPAGQTSSPHQLSRQNDQSPFGNTEDVDPIATARRLRALNEERQKSMVSDTEKLLKLAQELNAEIGSDDHSALTPIQVRKAADIEKLAHSVKQKMSTSFMAGPEFRGPLISPMQ